MEAQTPPASPVESTVTSKGAENEPRGRINGRSRLLPRASVSEEIDRILLSRAHGERSRS